MITFELAKELEDAGYVFTPKLWKEDDYPPKTYKLPTLHELIEAIEDGFAITISPKGKDRTFIIHSVNSDVDHKEYKSLDESLARHWLTVDELKKVMDNAN